MPSSTWVFCCQYRLTHYLQPMCHDEAIHPSSYIVSSHSHNPHLNQNVQLQVHSTLSSMCSFVTPDTVSFWGIPASDRLQIHQSRNSTSGGKIIAYQFDWKQAYTSGNMSIHIKALHGQLLIRDREEQNYSNSQPKFELSTPSLSDPS